MLGTASFLMENSLMNRQTRRKLALAILMLLVIIPSSLYVIRPASATATYIDSPVAGWGATRLKDTDPNSTAPNSVIFPGQKASNFEQLALREASLGYNTIRGSFSPYCTAKFGLTPPDPSNYHFIGDYNATQLARAIKIANYLSFWLVVDYHGYSDLTNSTTSSCWQSVWFGNSTNTISGPTGIVGQFKNNYTRIIWEPLNEPTSLPGANATAQTTYLSSQYQTWINNDRRAGDTHSIVVQNICSFGCGFCPTGNGDCSSAVNGYPTVNDTLGKVFISLHTYMSPLTSGNGFPNGYTNASADADATAYYNTVVSGITQTGWPALNTEGGAFVSNGVNKTIPQGDIILKVAAGYANITLHFIQTLTNLYDANTPQRIGHLWWPAASWASYPYTGTYGALNLNNGWGSLLTFKHFSVFALVTATTQTASELTVPESEQRTFQNPRGQHGYYVFYRDSISSVQTCYYATSPDGSGWTSAQSIGLSTLYDSCGVTYAQDSANSRTLVYFVASRHSTSVGTGHNIVFRIGSIADANVSLTWLTTIATLRTSNSTENLGYPVVAQDSNGYLHVAFSYTNDATGTISDKENVEVCSSTTAHPVSNPSWVCSNPRSNNPFPVESATNIDTPVAMPHVLPLASGILVIKGVCSGAETNFITCSLGSDVIERSAVMTWNGSTQTWGNTASFSFIHTNPRAEVRTSAVNDTGSFRVQYAYEDGGNLTTRYLASPYTTWSSATVACICGNVYGAHFTHVTGSTAFERFVLFYSTGYFQFSSVNATDNQTWGSAQLEYLNGTYDSDYPTSAAKVIETSPGTNYIPVEWVQAIHNRQIWFDKRPLN